MSAYLTSSGGISSVPGVGSKSSSAELLTDHADATWRAAEVIGMQSSFAPLLAFRVLASLSADFLSDVLVKLEERPLERLATQIRKYAQIHLPLFPRLKLTTDPRQRRRAEVPCSRQIQQRADQDT